MKIITICGSLRFKDTMIKEALKLELEGNIVLCPIFFDVNNDLSEEELLTLRQMHEEKIKLSDAVFIVNENDYIGESTKSEIEFAQKMCKEIIYLN